MYENKSFNKFNKKILLRGGNMEIELNEILNNSHNRNMKERIIIFDDKGDYYIFKHSNIMERVKQMKVERFEIVSEKLIVLKVEGIINDVMKVKGVVNEGR